MFSHGKQKNAAWVGALRESPAQAASLTASYPILPKSLPQLRRPRFQVALALDAIHLQERGVPAGLAEFPHRLAQFLDRALQGLDTSQERLHGNFRFGCHNTITVLRFCQVKACKNEFPNRLGQTTSLEMLLESFRHLYVLDAVGLEKSAANSERCSFGI